MITTELPTAPGLAPAVTPPGRSRARAITSWSVTGLAWALVWAALVGPDQPGQLTALDFVRVPLEGLAMLWLVLVLPPIPRRISAIVFGLFLGVLSMVKLLDLGFYEALGRPFDPIIDWTYVRSARGVLSDSIGRDAANNVLLAAEVLCVLLLTVLPLATVRVANVAARHRSATWRATAAVAIAWVVCAAFGVQIMRGVPVAAKSAVDLAVTHVNGVRSSLRSEQTFATAARVDPWRGATGDDLLSALRGKDVVFAFVESYGRVAVEGSAFSDRVDAALEADTARLREAGFSARSAFLTSPTFGGISWLAHSTFQSGLWIDNQRRYDSLVASDRFTLSDAFGRAGWRTVVDVPSNRQSWPQATSFYHYDAVYDAHNVGYRGPSFSYATMPDQYTLSAFDRMELGTPGHQPVMAEIDLVSSHTPWAPLPRMVPASDVGDGSIFNGMPQSGATPTEVWRDADQVRAAYGSSIEYSLNALTDFVRSSHDDNLVLVLLGDHQPARLVSGQQASHDVPISVVAHDPAVLAHITGWDWTTGLLPAPGAPVWRMDTFRNRFLEAYSRPSR